MNIFYAVVYTGFREWGVPGAMGVLFYIGEIRNLAFLQIRKFLKNVKKQWKNYKFEIAFKEFLRFLKVWQFRENLMKSVEHAGNMDV